MFTIGSFKAMVSPAETKPIKVAKDSTSLIHMVPINKRPKLKVVYFTAFFQ